MDRLEALNRNAVRPEHTLLPPPPPRPRGPGSFKRERSYGNRRRRLRMPRSAASVLRVRVSTWRAGGGQLVETSISKRLHDQCYRMSLT